MIEGGDVSRETTIELRRFQELLLRWNKTVNLVGRSTEGEIYTRHIQESLALHQVADRAGRWMDLGSGGGFPGIPLALAFPETITMILVESDVRKCEFLRAAKRTLGLPVEIVCERIERMDGLGVDVLVSRALAPLSTLLSYVVRHGGTDSIGVFPKGRTWQSEVDVARRHWSFNLEVHPTVTNPDAAILRVANVLPL